MELTNPAVLALVEAAEGEVAYQKRRVMTTHGRALEEALLELRGAIEDYRETKTPATA